MLKQINIKYFRIKHVNKQNGNNHNQTIKNPTIIFIYQLQALYKNHYCKQLENQLNM